MTWGAPRIRNELAKLGIEVAVSTVARYMVKQRKPSSPSWRAFLDNHVKDLVAIDFFTVPTATFGVLFGFLVLAHDRRRVLHFNVTANPTAEWTTRQVIQAFPEETGPRFLVRDRDRIYSERFRHVIDSLGIEDVVTAARSPWQNPYVERLIGSLRPPADVTRGRWDDHERVRRFGRLGIALPHAPRGTHERTKMATKVA